LRQAVNVSHTFMLIVAGRASFALTTIQVMSWNISSIDLNLALTQQLL